MGSDTMVEAINKIAKDPNIKAIVMRVDSPGGSALASDLIWQALKKSGKPVVVSMGDVAGSGGYYISMGANKIFAEPGTITGSIGVISMKPALEGLYKMVGINNETISRGKNSGIFSDRPWSDSEREAMLRISKDIYAQFTQKAAEGRKMELDKLLSLAGGRIWTGRQAKANGLVDEIGTLDDAIAEARKLGKLEPGNTELESFPKSKNPFEALFGGGDDSANPLDAQITGIILNRLPAGLRPLVTIPVLTKDRVFLLPGMVINIQ
jgi:protease-4